MEAIANFFSASGKEERHYKIEGKNDFFIEPSVTKGKLPLHSSSVCLKVYRSKEKLEPLAVKVKWFRCLADRNYEITDVENS